MPVYQTIIDEFKRHFHDPDFHAERFFTFHDDPEVSKMAVEMIAEKYQLDAKDDQRLGELVTQLLYEIKLTLINQQLEEMTRSLQQAQAENNTDRMRQLLSLQPELIKARNEICKLLGNRVINI